MFQKKGVFRKYWLKYTDRQAYHQYKWELANQNKINFSEKVFSSVALTNAERIIEFSRINKTFNLSHSGNAGDIIYALATIKKISEITGAVINLYLVKDQPLHYRGESAHPLGNVMLNDKMVDMLIPLLSAQSYISICKAYAGEKIDMDLDFFRNGLIPLDKGNIAKWYGYICGINADLAKPWLKVVQESLGRNKILIARSERYRGRKIDYSFLKERKDINFIGVESEYLDISKSIPGIQWIKVSDFLEMATIISSCRFFIGNQSFPYSIAEALKVPRILETSFEVINVVPEGGLAFDFLFQDHFESLVKILDLETRLN